MARTLNIKRLERLLAQDRRRQEQAKKPPEPPKEKEEEVHYSMSAHELEKYLTTFLQHMRDCNYNYEQTKALEYQPNAEIQDLLHVAEFAPSKLASVDLLSVMARLRQQRRDAKKELEVMERLKAWKDENQTALNKLENVLGDIRKILNRQPQDYYVYKTNIVGEKGTILAVEDPDYVEPPVAGLMRCFAPPRPSSEETKGNKDDKEDN